MKQSIQQMSEEQKQQELQKIQQNTEAKTVINGKEVPLKEALKAEELFNEQNTQTGINQAHDNSSEAVKAGGFAQNMQQQEAQGQQAVKQSNVQSGQKEFEKHLEQARQQVLQEEQQAQQSQQAGYNIQPKPNEETTQEATKPSKAKAKNQAGQ